MKPSSLSRRAISDFRRELGISTLSWSARFAFRIRASMSAIGSVCTLRVLVSTICDSHVQCLLPARLRHARDHALVGEIAQADPAQPELLVNRARPAAAVAPRVVAHPELLRACLLLDQRLPSQTVAPSVHSSLRTAARARAGARAPARRSVP